MRLEEDSRPRTMLDLKLVLGCAGVLLGNGRVLEAAEFVEGETEAPQAVFSADVPA